MHFLKKLLILPIAAFAAVLFFYAIGMTLWVHVPGWRECGPLTVCRLLFAVCMFMGFWLGGVLSYCLFDATLTHILRNYLQEILHYVAFTLAGRLFFSLCVSEQMGWFIGGFIMYAVGGYFLPDFSVSRRGLQPRLITFAQALKHAARLRKKGAR